MLHYLGCTGLNGIFAQSEVYKPGAHIKLEGKEDRRGWLGLLHQHKLQVINLNPCALAAEQNL